MTRFSDFELTDFTPYLLNQAADATSRRFQKSYKSKYGMLRTEWRVLFHLGIFGQMTATEIGGRAKIHKTKVSRAVQRLSERRFVRRARSEEDRRVEWLELTPAGQKAYEDLREVAANYEAELQSKLTRDEVALLKDVLKKLSTGPNPR